MITPTMPNLSRPGSTTPWILPRSAWRQRLFTAVALLAEMPHTTAVAVVLVANLIGTSR
jgi:hypothetical protein